MSEIFQIYEIDFKSNSLIQFGCYSLSNYIQLVDIDGNNS